MTSYGPSLEPELSYRIYQVLHGWKGEWIKLMIRMFHLSLFVIIVATGLGGLKAYAQPERACSDRSDLSWLRDFAVPATPEALMAAGAGEENKLNWDPRFATLLGLCLPQQQSFWFDHGRFTPVPELAQEFIGVPGSVLMNENRYITVNGCVPHDCEDRGMVWIDTASTQKPLLVFAATGNVIRGSAERGHHVHLWLFSSVNWQELPAQFSSSLPRWWNKTKDVWEQWNPERIVLVTLVQPSGEMVDLSPSLFAFK